MFVIKRVTKRRERRRESVFCASLKFTTLLFSVIDFPVSLGRCQSYTTQHFIVPMGKFVATACTPTLIHAKFDR